MNALAQILFAWAIVLAALGNVVFSVAFATVATVVAVLPTTGFGLEDDET